jgi:hypothetical protein
MDTDADLRAPGAAITAELCGHWDHDPPCPLAPHHSRAERAGGEVRVRVLFAAEPGQEHLVRQRIESALASGQLEGLDGVTTRWQLSVSQCSDIEAGEAGHAGRLIRA